MLNSDKMPETDGYCAGWVAVLAMWTRKWLWVGIVKGMGVMLSTLQVQFATQTWIVGWITALVAAIGGISGPFAGLLSRRFPTGYVLMTCGAMSGVAVIAGSFTKTALQLALVFTLLAGVPLGVSNVLCKEAVGRCFTYNYATATGIARTGYSVGLIMWPPLVQLFLNTYGWRGTMLLLGGISLHLVVCGALMVATDRTRLPSSDSKLFPRGDPSSEHQTNYLSCCSTFVKYVVKNFDLELLRIARYWLVAAISSSTAFAYTMWLIYFVSQAQSIGFALEEAGTFAAIAGIADLLAKVSQGRITDSGLIPPWCLTAIAIIACSVSYCATPWLTSYWIMMTSACLLLFSNGVIACQTDVLIKQALGVDLLAGAFGWIGMTTSIFSFALGFLPGWMYDFTGSYNSAFLLIGCVQASAMIPLLTLRYRNIL